jgi:hypothetical protein
MRPFALAPQFTGSRAALVFLHLAEFQFDQRGAAENDTVTLSRERASSTSSTTPLKDAKGPARRSALAADSSIKALTV